MKNHTRLTLDDLIARKEQREQATPCYKDVYIDMLGGNILVEKIPLRQLIGVMEGLDSGSPQDALQAKIDIIYSCCPIMRKKELQDVYSCAEPTEIVCKLFQEKLGPINKLVLAILDLYGMGDDESIEEVKN